MSAPPTLDCLIVGAGFGGIFQLYKCRNELGLKCRLIDSFGGPGGTWYANRYPGAMSDTESHLYRYSWDKELLNEYPWPEHYSKQPQVLGYLEHVCDRYDLRKDMQFNTDLVDAHWDETEKIWHVKTSKDEEIRVRYLITALGLLSAINWPEIKGRETFKGTLLHTGAWPQGTDLTGKRVGVIGNGSTGVQVITAIAPKVKELFCFQRSPQYSVPAQDGPVAPEFRNDIVDNWDTVWAKVRKSLFGFGFEEATHPMAHYSEEERQERLQAAWNHGGGFNFMFGPFNDVAINEEANDYVAEFIRKKIALIVKDPEKARLLTPHDLYARRPLCDSNYYSRFNQDNVHIVNCRETPIVEFVPEGIKTSDGKVHEVDVVVCATGFNAVDGNYNRVRFHGKGGINLAQEWQGGPSSYLGSFIPHFPNLFMILGPTGPFSNIPPAIEAQVEFATGLLKAANGQTFEATEEAREEWVEKCQKLSDMSLFSRVRSWIYGVNATRAKDGKFKPIVQFYLGGLAPYIAVLEEVRQQGYKGLTFGGAKSA